MKKYFVSATHYMYEDSQRMIEAEKPKELHRYIDMLLRNGYIIRCIREVRV